jgi:two-component system, LytTR family, response regulator
VIKTLIIDDEESTVNVLKLLLQKNVPEIQEVFSAVGAAAGEKLLNELKPRLVFLDIEMPLMNGFELLEKFPQHDFDVIFVTAYDHYAIKAIKYSALDYLLKPVDTEELKNAVQRFFEKQNNKQSTKPLYDNLLYNLSTKKQEDYRLAIATNEGTFFFQPDEIIRCEAVGNYTKFFLSNKNSFLSSRTLKEYDELLTDKEFLRVHRTHLVNRKYINSFSGDRELKLTDGSFVEVSRRKWDTIKNRLVNA